MTVNKVKKSLEACSSKNRKCEECVCNGWLFDTCQIMLMKIAIKTICSLEDDNKILKEDVDKTIKELQEIIGG